MNNGEDCVGYDDIAYEVWKDKLRYEFLLANERNFESQHTLGMAWEKFKRSDDYKIIYEVFALWDYFLKSQVLEVVKGM